MLLTFCLTTQDRNRIQIHLKMKDAKHLRARYLKPLLADGLLEMTDPEHPNAPNQKYQTTVLGRAALEADAEDSYLMGIRKEGFTE